MESIWPLVSSDLPVLCIRHSSLSVGQRIEDLKSQKGRLATLAPELCCCASGGQIRIGAKSCWPAHLGPTASDLQLTATFAFQQTDALHNTASEESRPCSGQKSSLHRSVDSNMANDTASQPTLPRCSHGISSIPDLTGFCS